VTLLDVYGSLFYAGARTLHARLPEVGAAVQPAVVLRLRGRMMLGATAFKVFSDYSQSLRAAQGKLYLSGVDPELIEQFTRARHVEATGPVEVVEATPNLGESSLTAYHQAQTWVIENRTDE